MTYVRRVRRVDLAELVQRCPYPRWRPRCTPVDLAADLWSASTARRPGLHRHNHLNCVTDGTLGIHPREMTDADDDEPSDRWHREPDLYRAARKPLQGRWPAPWQVAATTIVASRTSHAQAEAALERLYAYCREPSQLADRLRITAALSPVGTRPVNYLVDLGNAWRPYVGAGWNMSLDDLARVHGVGPMTLEAYAIFTMGIRPDVDLFTGQPVWINPVLAVADALGSLPPF